MSAKAVSCQCLVRNVSHFAKKLVAVTDLELSTIRRGVAMIADIVRSQCSARVGCLARLIRLYL